MKKSAFSIVMILLILVILVVACWAGSSFAFRENDTTSNSGCHALPKNFSESDLVGTWVARSIAEGIDIRDTLIIKADGSYRQIIHNQIGDKYIDYEGEWQSWRFEKRGNETGYLYMKNFRICAANMEYSCAWVNDGKTPWADVCEGQWIKPYPSAGEIILVVYGYPFLDPNQKVSHPFSLTLFQGFEAGGWSYNFQEH